MQEIKGEAMICARVEKERAEEVLQLILRNGCLDKTKKVERDERYVYFPLLKRLPGLDIVERECRERERFVPFREIAKRLDVNASLLPKKWEKFGDVVVIKLPLPLEERKEEIGRVYAQVLKAKAVLVDRKGIAGEFRKPNFEIIYGNDTVTVHKEAGTYFKFDVQKLMYASGNIFERRRLASLVKEGEVIVDMFAGIGYFSLHLAKTKCARIYACEKNPEAFEFLCENIRLNKAEEKVIPLLGDCREVAPKNIAHRVVMGYLKETSKFLPYAVKCLRDGKGVIHYHDVVKAGEHERELIERVKNYLSDFEVLNIRVVKSYAPRMVHAVADLRL